MICERGHRVIDSNELHYSLRELPPSRANLLGWSNARSYEYVYGDCAEVESQVQPEEAAR